VPPAATSSAEGLPTFAADTAIYRFDKPFPWSNLPVTGSLVFITYDSPTGPSAMPVPFIARLDLATGEVNAAWRPPENSWLSGMELSPDRSQLAIVYAPPPPPGMLQSGRPGLYLLPGKCLTESCLDSEPQPLVEPTETDSYFEPAWTADGASLYYSHIASPPNAQVPDYSVARVALSGGAPEEVIPLATWPRPSRDGTLLAYVAFDILNYVNDLYFASPDGSNARPAMPPGTFSSVDAPVFSPDGQYIYFSATGPGPQGSNLPPAGQPRSLVEILTGAQPAFANGMPSEWWRLPVAGGTPARLTDIGASGLSGNFSPDGQFFAFVSFSGLGMIAADGGRFAWIYPATTQGNVIWLP
jgi:hypothetical protein